MMRYTTELKTLLKKAHPHLKHYVATLEGENVKLQRQIAKLHATALTLRNRVTALQKETKKRKIQVTINREDVNW